MNSIGIAGFNLLTISIDKMRVLSATGGPESVLCVSRQWASVSYRYFSYIYI